MLRDSSLRLAPRQDGGCGKAATHSWATARQDGSMLLVVSEVEVSWTVALCDNTT